MADQTIVVAFKGDTSGITSATNTTNDSVKAATNNMNEFTKTTSTTRAEVNGMWHDFSAGSELASGSLRGLRALITTTGIGALVIAVGALFEILKKFDIFKDIFGDITDAMGITTHKADELAAAEKVQRDASIEGLNNEITLLKAKGATMDEIYHKELALAAAKFESIKAEMLADLQSAKHADLAKKGGELDQKLQVAKTAYFALLAVQEKTEYDQGTDYINKTRLLKEKDLTKELDEIQIEEDAHMKLYPTDYAAYTYYETKKTVAAQEYAVKQAKVDADAAKKALKAYEDHQKEIERLDKQEYDAGLVAQKNYEKSLDKSITDANKTIEKDEVEHWKVLEKNTEDYQALFQGNEATYLANMKIIWQYQGDTEIEIAEKTAAAKKKIDDEKLAYTETIENDITSILSSAGEKNKKIALLAVAVQAGISIANVITKFAESDAAISASASALAIPTFGASLIEGAALISKNTIQEAFNIAAIVAGAVVKFEKGGLVPKAAIGGFINGPSHANGGVNLNAEGGEYIINKNAMKNPNIASQAAALNAGQSSGIDYNKLASTLANELRSSPLQAVASEQQFTLTQKKVAKRNSQFEHNYHQ